MENYRERIVVVVLVAAIVSLGIAVWALLSQESPEKPQSPAPAAEEQVTPSGSGEDEKMEQPPGGGAVNITYSNQVTISLSEQQGHLLMINPYRSNQSLSLELMSGEMMILQSGAILPGYQVESLPLLEGVDLSPGNYTGKFKIRFYDTQTGKQALLNTDIPVSITVTS